MLGGGVIGVEFASTWASFGTEVTIVEALPTLVPLEDPWASKLVERAFRKRKIAFKTGVRFQGVKQDDSGVTVTLEDGTTLNADLLLVAVGRGPYTAGCGYEEAGITMDRGFVITDERLHTNLPHVYAVGDIVPGLQLAHRGFQQGIFVAEEIAGLNPVVIPDEKIPKITYCDPNVASVGLTEAKAKEVHGRRRVLRLRPRRQRQVADPQDRRRDQGRPGQGRPDRRHPHGRRPDRRADRRGPADRRLGGLPGGRRTDGARPPVAVRGHRRGDAGDGRQAAARPRLMSADGRAAIVAA